MISADQPPGGLGVDFVVRESVIEVHTVRGPGPGEGNSRRLHLCPVNRALEGGNINPPWPLSRRALRRDQQLQRGSKHHYPGERKPRRRSAVAEFSNEGSYRGSRRFHSL